MTLFSALTKPVQIDEFVAAATTDATTTAVTTTADDASPDRGGANA